MLEISIHFLAGRFHATPWGRNPREGEPEWPPAPWRLLRSLVSGFYRIGCEQTDLFGQLLRQLATPPEYHLPTATTAHSRQYFPQYRPADKPQMLFDAFIKVAPDKPVIYRWPKLDLSDDEKQLLTKLLGGISYFGRAESWAELVCSDQFSGGSATNCSTTEPDDHGDPVRILGGQTDVTLEQLGVQTKQLQKQGWSQPPGSKWLTYYRSPDCFAPKYSFAPTEFKPVALRFAYLPPVRPRRANTLFAAETIRTDILQLIEKRAPEFFPQFSGKVTSEDGTVSYLEGHLHPYIFPVTTGGLEHLLDEVIIYRRPINEDESFPAKIQELFCSDLPSWQATKNRTHGLHFIEALGKDQLASLPQFRPSSTWDSFTPYVQTRHLKRGKEELADQVRGELNNHNFLGWDKLERVECLDKASLGGLHVCQYKTQRQHRPKPQAGLHNLRLHFSENVTGPLAIGYGAHFGLGQFTPVD